MYIYIYTYTHEKLISLQKVIFIYIFQNAIGSYAVLTLVYYIPPVHENCYESLSFFLKVFCLKIKNSCNIRNAGVFAVCFALDISWKVLTCCIFSYHIYIYIYTYIYICIYII